MGGLKGPAPTPTKILELRGSWRAKTRHGEPQPPPAGQAPPEWLTPEAIPVWDRLVPRLAIMGLFTTLDIEAVGRYCMLFAQWHKAMSLVAQRGMTYPLRDKLGQITGFAEYPEIGMAIRLGPLLTRLEQMFGLSPAARARLINTPPAATTKESHGQKPNKTRLINVG